MHNALSRQSPGRMWPGNRPAEPLALSRVPVRRGPGQLALQVEVSTSDPLDAEVCRFQVQNRLMSKIQSTIKN